MILKVLEALYPMYLAYCAWLCYAVCVHQPKIAIGNTMIPLEVRKK